MMEESYKNFAERMGSFEETIDIDMSETIQHAGVKGMKWGIRKTVKANLESMKRERSWRKVDVSKLTTSEINKQAQRAQLENDFKRLSKRDVVKKDIFLKKSTGSEKDRQDYLNRAKLSDSELNKRVNELRAKENFDRNVNMATKSQIDFAKKALYIAGPIVLQLAINKKISPKQVMDVVMNPKNAKAQAIAQAKKFAQDKVLKK